MVIFMRTCIYCRQSKLGSEFSLEHVIPQCLGGLTVPDELKTRDVCKRCNNDLGLFVDASFEKSWFVSKQLQENARLQFDHKNPSGIPLICMGPCDLKVPGLQLDEVCESWLGPFGEQVYWLRPLDERLYWYDGGNPRTTKSSNSRAYFMFSVNSRRNPILTWLSFERAFPGRRVRKIMCAQVDGANPKNIGFSEPDQIDKERIEFFMGHCFAEPSRNVRLAMYMNFDLRFMAKLAIGLSHCLYGKAGVCEEYADELHKALWYRPGDELPLINASSLLRTEFDKIFSDYSGLRGAVVLMVVRDLNGVMVNLNLGGKLNWAIKIAENVNGISDRDDQVFIIFSEIGKCFRMPLQDYIAFRCGFLVHAELDEVIQKIKSVDEYFEKLAQA